MMDAVRGTDDANRSTSAISIVQNSSLLRNGGLVAEFCMLGISGILGPTLGDSDGH